MSDDPVVMQGESNAKWTIRLLRDNAEVLEFSIDRFVLAEPVTLQPGDDIEVRFKMIWKPGSQSLAGGYTLVDVDSDSPDKEQLRRWLKNSRLQQVKLMGRILELEEALRDKDEA